MYLADVSGYSGTWRGQSTHLRPVVSPWNKIDNSDGQLTSSTNILQDMVFYLCFCVNYSDQFNDLNEILSKIYNLQNSYEARWIDL